MDREELVFFPTWTAGREGYTERVRAVFSEYLTQHGLRLTRQRLRILDFLLAAERHLGVEDIYQSLKKHGIGRATVFRTLRMLEECRLVSHVTSAGGAARFEVGLERPHHDHLICVDCSRILEVRWPELERIQQKACKKLGFEPSWHRHEIFGRCAECRAKRAA
ncbi:MAG TPA: Fur family transcriptional regulator [Elusimicrobiota bacterium]|jgi:Fur family ferric uptake transcriptional regulator|nr:Fur family transcriptional regulator [Elusimicrobiota bacterium]